MDNFIVSARKYRPETFASVVGQASITGTLKSAIQKKQLGHAYLFCGPRGVGKTTCARIFAKTINCMEPGQDAEPCNTCESCLSFNESRAFNIHELDAASNNSVEDIRNLTDQVRIPPQVGKYSIYIIDEVHMLSASAFNAFLKTLEEPPAHAVFILATTEKHKIIPTILSRCQIFDFNRIRVEDIVSYLEYISGQEGVEYEADAFNVIALKADGAMRDALSIYDQMVSFSGKMIRYQDVIENLNILDYEYYFRLTESCFSGMAGETLVVFDEILSKGFDAHNFLSGFSSHLRDLLVCLDEITLKLLEVGAGIREKYKSQSKKVEQEWLYAALEILGSADISFRMSRNQRLHVELALIKLCRLQGESKKKALTSKPEAEEARKKFNAGSSTADNQVPASEVPAAQSSATESPDTEIPAKEVPAAEVPADKAAATESPATETPAAQSAATESPDTEHASADSAARKSETGEVSKPPGEIVKHEQVTPARTDKPGPGLPSIKDALNGVHKKKEEENGIGNSGEVAVLSAPFNQEDLLRHWDAYTESIKNEKPRMANSLKHHLPRLGDALQIELVLSNSAQLEEFQSDIKPELLVYLEKALQNNQFKILPVIAETEEQQNTLYTSEEKFDHMVKKNPELGKLKERFNLDFE